MKQIYLLVAIFFFSVTAFAQARITTAQYQKISQPALEIEIPFAEKTVMKSVVDKLESAGYKGKDTKGYYTFTGVKLPEFGTESYDLYFKTERKSRREKDNTLLTMLIGNGYEKFIDEAAGSVVIGNAKKFLNNQAEAATAFDLEMQITDQEELSKKAEKKLATLIENAQDLQKKKEKLVAEIADNIKRQAEQKVEAEKQTTIFNNLKTKRKQ